MGRHRDNALAHDAWLHPVAVPQQVRRENPNHLFLRVRCRGHQNRGASTQIPVGIPVGYEPALFNPNEKLGNAISVTGQILGTQVESQRIDETLNFDLIDPDWINNTYMPIRLLIREVGVFFAWNPADFSSHVIYGAVVGDPKASYSQVDCMRLQLKMEGPKHVL